MAVRLRQYETGEPQYPSGLWFSDSETGDRRWTPKSFHPDVTKIANQGVKIYDLEPQRLCSSSPVNFCGTLFFALEQARFLSRVTKLCRGWSSLPESAAYPLRILHNVPLHMYRKRDVRSGGYSPLHQTAPLVLFKQCCGAEAGVVLQGPLTGLILDTIDTDENPAHGMIANRIWNDERLEQDDHPYLPLITPLNTPIADDDRHKIHSDFLRRYDAYLRKNKLKPPIWSSAVFFQLCRDLKIPLDEKRFQFLRSQQQLRSSLLDARHTR